MNAIGTPVPSAAQINTCTQYCQSANAACIPRIVITPTPEVIKKEYHQGTRAPFTHYFENGGSEAVDLGIYTCSVALRLGGRCHCDPVSDNPSKNHLTDDRVE